MPAIALWIYATWTLGLLLSIAAMRVSLSLARKHPPNKFSPSGEDVSPFSGRLCRAHANCYENLPIVVALVLAAAISDNLGIMEHGAVVLVLGRIAQSVTHLASTSVRAVTLRFGFLAVQAVVLLYWTAALGFRLLSA